MHVSPTFLVLAKAVYAPILRCNGNNVRIAANFDPMPTNAITFENTPKHSTIEMFFTVGLTAMTAKEADQVPQGVRREEDCVPLIRRWTSF
jgi:hypothetical protein